MKYYTQLEKQANRPSGTGNLIWRDIMKTIEVTKKTANGVEVSVTATFGMAEQTINADGDIIKLAPKFEKNISVKIIKDGDIKEHSKYGIKPFVIDHNISKWAPAAAYAKIGSSYVSKEVWDAYAAALAEAEAQIEEPQAEKPTAKMIRNPAYAHMTDEQIKAAEVNYDNVQNEGYSDSGNFNPYRDLLYVVEQ